MKYLLHILAAALLLTVALPTHPAENELPTASVRVVATAETDKVCSAVVIAPGYALTARHCLSAGMSVDGIVVDAVTLPAVTTKDIALLHAPGLRCPCATLGGRPAIGTRVVAVGFPHTLKGEQRISESANVTYIGSPVTLAPWLAPYALVVNSVFIFTNKAILASGDSGGGLFAVQGGRWVLVGINAIGLPAAPHKELEQASGFTPVDFAVPFLPKA
jgi:hypothetical protein